MEGYLVFNFSFYVGCYKVLVDSFNQDHFYCLLEIHLQYIQIHHRQDLINKLLDFLLGETGDTSWMPTHHRA